jgi:hypothetical protein
MNGGKKNLQGVLAPIVGPLMLVYAYGLWQLRRFALPMGIAYGVLGPRPEATAPAPA